MEGRTGCQEAKERGSQGLKYLQGDYAFISTRQSFKPYKYSGYDKGSCRPKIRDQQAGFRKNISYTEQIASLRNKHSNVLEFAIVL